MDILMNKEQERKKKVYRLAIAAGEVMVKNGAEIYRAEDTMIRICQSYGLFWTTVYVTPGIIIICDTRYDGLTFMRSIRNRTVDLKKVAEVNNFARRFMSEDLDFDESLEMISKIDKSRSYAKRITVLGAALTSCMFALMFGGSLRDFFGAMLVSAITYTCYQQLSKFSLSSMLNDSIAGFLLSLLAFIITYFNIGDSRSIIIIGSLMPFVPGVSLTNGIRDLIAGDLISGFTRISEAMLVALSLAIGLGVPIFLFQ